MTQTPLRLRWLPGSYAVCRFDPGKPLPGWVGEELGGTRSRGELHSKPGSNPGSKPESNPGSKPGPTLGQSRDPVLGPGPPSTLLCVTRTARELCCVCEESLALSAFDGAFGGASDGAADGASTGGETGERPSRIESGFAAITVVGPLDFSLVGILATLTTALAEARVPVFVLSTFDTDILLVRAVQAGVAYDALRRVAELDPPP